MSSVPAVSVIIPSYNRRDLLMEAVDSVLAQTFQDYELIVVDHGSSDGTPAALQSRFGSNVRLISLPPCDLPACPRNAGIEAAKGTWIAFLDSDDLWLPDKLETQMEAARRDPSAGLVYSLAERFDARGSRGVIPPRRLRRSGQVFHSLLAGNFMPLLTTMVRRTALDEAGHFNTDPGLRGVEDYELWLRVTYRHSVRLVPRILARYRLHDANASRNLMVIFDHQENAIKTISGLYPIPGLNKHMAAFDMWRFKTQLRGDAESSEVLRHLSRCLARDPHCLETRLFQFLAAIGLFPVLRRIARFKARFFPR